MPFIPYQEHCTLHNGHKEGINVVSFSPNGDLLASGADDNAVVLWDVHNGSLLQKIITRSPVLSFAWNYNQMNTLFLGCQDGTIYCIRSFNPYRKNTALQVLTDLEAPVETLDFDSKSNHLAIGIGSEVQVAKKISEDDYAAFVIMPAPSNTLGKVEYAPIKARAVHFLPSGRKLIASYLNHGIVCWDIIKRTQLWAIPPTEVHPHIGSSSISGDFRHILTHNFDGMDLYKLTTLQRVQTYRVRVDPEVNYPVKVGFASDGRSVVNGSPDGQIRIWDKVSGKPQQILLYSDHVIQAICTHQGSDFALIAAATSETTDNTTLRIWKAQIKRQSATWNAMKLLEYLLDLAELAHGYMTTLPFRPLVVGFWSLAAVILGLVAAKQFEDLILMQRAIQSTFIGGYYELFRRTSALLRICRNAGYLWWISFKPQLKKILRDLLDD